MSTLLTVLTLLLMLVITLNTVEPIWNSIRHYLTKSQKHHSLTGSPILWIKRMLKRVDGISGSRSFAKDCLFTLVKSRLALGSPGWLFVRLSPCRKWPNTQENGFWLPPSDHIQSETLFQSRKDQERGIIGPLGPASILLDAGSCSFYTTKDTNGLCCKKWRQSYKWTNFRNMFFWSHISFVSRLHLLEPTAQFFFAAHKK